MKLEKILIFLLVFIAIVSSYMLILTSNQFVEVYALKGINFVYILANYGNDITPVNSVLI